MSFVRARARANHSHLQLYVCEAHSVAKIWNWRVLVWNNKNKIANNWMVKNGRTTTTTTTTTENIDQETKACDVWQILCYTHDSTYETFFLFFFSITFRIVLGLARLSCHLCQSHPLLCTYAAQVQIDWLTIKFLISFIRSYKLANLIHNNCT